MKKLTQKRLKELFDYKDGELLRRTSVKGGGPVGSVAGCITPHGYIQICVDRERYLAHVLIFFYHHGFFPENDVDHEDKNQLNNKIKNLRNVSRQCNARNVGNSSSNKSGVKGVYYDRNRKQWVSQITINCKGITLGYNKCFTEAVALRLSAEQCVEWDGCDSSSPSYMYISGLSKPKKVSA